MSESDQYGPRHPNPSQARLLLSTTPFENSLITVVKEGQLLFIFIVPAIAVAYCYPPTPFSLFYIFFRAVPLVRMYDGFS